MKTIPAELLTAMASSEATVFHIAAIQAKTGPSLNVTDCEVNLTYNAITYSPMPLDVGDFTNTDSNPLDGGELRVGNADNSLSGEVRTGFYDDAAVTISELYLDSSGAVIGANVIFSGVVDGTPSDIGEWVTFVVMPAHDFQSASCPRRRIERICGWREFGDADCQYNGSAETCDRSLARCTQVGNTARFSGFDFLPIEGTLLIVNGKRYRIGRAQE